MRVGLALLLSPLPALALDDGLARTPQMGWNNWNSLGCNVSEDLLIDTANLLVKLGLRDLGYNYVLLDDCWSDGRVDRKLQVDKKRFPHGMKWVAKQIHDMGLKYGMYSSAGTLTCARYEGSLGYKKEDAESFASWDVDYLKYDNCYSAGRHGSPPASFERYKAMGDALKATGREIFYSLCNWGEDMVQAWGWNIAHSWRISGDIYDSFSRPDALCSCTEYDPSSPWCVAPGNQCSVLSIINRVAPYIDKGQPGGWQDMDMLEVGHGGMTDDEYKAHFAMWAALKSPLIIGADIRHLSPSALTILNNPAIIALSQDPIGRPASRVMHDKTVKADRYGIGETQVWSGPLYGGDQVVILLNAGDKDETMTAYLEDIFVREGPGGSAPHNAVQWDVYDLWAYRMEGSKAKDIVEAAKLLKTNELARGTIGGFNIAQDSWKAARDRLDPQIIGKKVGQIKPAGSWKIKVARHSAAVYRLVAKDGSKLKRYSTTKDEL